MKEDGKVLRNGGQVVKEEEGREKGEREGEKEKRKERVREFQPLIQSAYSKSRGYLYSLKFHE